MEENAQQKNQKCVVVGVTGSIAAYKSAELTSLLYKQGHQVFVVMTRDATEFITPLTLQTLSKNPVMTSFYDEKENWRPGHIQLADRADLLLIAPATAHIIAELANGLAGHPLAAIALATRAQILVAPAMNGKMWEHPATQENVLKLRERGVEFIGPEEGMLACGYEGAGRLWKVDDIAFRAGVPPAARRQSHRVRIVVTAGPTREPIDPVRFISNRSSGKMGYAIAEAARDAGHEVTLITGPATIALPDDVDVVSISTSDELFYAGAQARRPLRCAHHVRRSFRLQAGEVFVAETREASRCIHARVGRHARHPRVTSDR
jgi:phosphopantothenoylcysteine decarboxylase/phosphopantothenate--cysteine ligase